LKQKNELITYFLWILIKQKKLLFTHRTMQEKKTKFTDALRRKKKERMSMLNDEKEINLSVLCLEIINELNIGNERKREKQRQLYL